MHREQARNHGESADSGYHVDRQCPCIGGCRATDLRRLLGRDRAIGLKLADIDQEFRRVAPSV
jgi:hypothetical protein